MKLCHVDVDVVGTIWIIHIDVELSWLEVDNILVINMQENLFFSERRNIPRPKLS